MEYLVHLARQLLRALQHRSGPRTEYDDLTLRLARAVCKTAWLQAGAAPWAEEVESMAKKVATFNALQDLGMGQNIANEKIVEATVEEPAKGAVGDRRVIYQQSKGRLYRIEQERKMVWQTQSVRRVLSMEVATEDAPKEVSAELDRLAPLNPRD